MSRRGCNCCGTDAPCNCDPVTLDFTSDGAGGLVSWYPTVELTPTESSTLPSLETDMTLVSKDEIFCASGNGPFRAAMEFAGKSHQLLGATLRVMARLSATIEDGIATIGDHIFLDVGEIDLQTTDAADTNNRIWYRLGVSIGGVETVLQSSANQITPGGSNQLSAVICSAMASSTGQIKFQVPGSVSFSDFAQAHQLFYEGDYFIALVSATITGSPGSLNVNAGEVWRLDNGAAPTNPASWTLVTTPASELSDVILCGGSELKGATIFLTDSDVDFTEIPGRRVGIRITDLPSGKAVETASVLCNNELSIISPLCDYHSPITQPAPVRRLTPFPVYSRDTTEYPDEMNYVNWFTTGLVQISPVLSYIGSSAIEERLLLDGASAGFRRYHYYKGGTYKNFNGTQDHWLYSRVLVGMTLDILQPRERRWTRQASIAVSYVQSNSQAEWSLAQIIAGTTDLSWASRAGQMRKDLALQTFTGNFATDQSITLVPDTVSSADMNTSRFSVCEGTIELPVPQP